MTRRRGCWCWVWMVVLALGCDWPAPAEPPEEAGSAPGASEEAGAQGTSGPDDARALLAWSAIAEELRGLPFRSPVRIRPLIPSEIPATIRAEIEELLPPEEVDAYRDAYAALGVLPPDVDLVSLFGAIYGAQMVGRYSRRERALYLLDGDSPGGYARETVAVHELVHALQDQHYPMAMMLSERLRHNDDLVSALSGVIEGDATFTMFAAEDGDPSTERTLATAERFRDDMLLELEGRFGPLGRAPLLIQVSVIFPYAFGTVLAAQRYAASGNAGLDALLRDAPLSTLELLAASGSAGGDDPAIEFVRLPDAWLQGSARRAGCRPGHHNVAGSLTVQVMLDQYGGGGSGGLEREWRGDRFLHLRCSGTHEIVWLTRWSDADAAARFAALYAAIASAVAANAPLSGEPLARVMGRSVLIATPAVRDLAAQLAERAEIRSYRSLGRWYEDGCFGESAGCPTDPEGVGGRAASLDSIDRIVANP